MIDTLLIDPTWTVTETLTRAPASAAVFDAFGIDAGRGGAAPIEEEASRGGVDLDALLDALNEAARVSAVIDEARRVAAELA